MIPLRDINPSHSFPLLTAAFITLNVWIFVENYESSERFAEALFELGYAPVDPFSIKKAFTSMFMHGSWIHLLLNMWVLWVFGDNVEDVLGKVGYVILYITSGLSALFMHILLYPHSEVPVVGASGAISGVMGAYLVLFPHAKIWTFFPPFYLTTLSARFFLVLWFFIQLIQGIVDKLVDWIAGQAGGIAFWAHIGGFGAGWLLALLLQPKRAGSERWDYLR
ncbi:MAG: rhomboid family intramembrane serine protease [Bacteroidia bacterium]|nr:rhomboid family intramembrane serine protease [Bacteroidia bacterium]MDW8016019.1 rhomboid family intramembrane serine protease [Bacteroidia bacterium]